MAVPAGTAPAIRPTPGTYAIAPTRSTVNFTTRHLFGLAGVAGTFALCWPARKALTEEGPVWLDRAGVAGTLHRVRYTRHD